MKVKNGSWSAAATPNFLIKVFSPQKKWPKTLIVWSNKKKRKFQKPIYRKLMNEQVITHCEIVIRIRGEWLFIVTSWCQNSLHTHCIVWKGFPSTRNFQRKQSSRFIIQRRQKKKTKIREIRKKRALAVRTISSDFWSKRNCRNKKGVHETLSPKGSRPNPDPAAWTELW